LNYFSQRIGQGTLPLLSQIHNILPHLLDHYLQVYIITHLFESQRYYPISNPETLIAQFFKQSEQVNDIDLKGMLSE
jgi:hypothetical protein